MEDKNRELSIEEMEQGIGGLGSEPANDFEREYWNLIQMTIAYRRNGKRDREDWLAIVPGEFKKYVEDNNLWPERRKR